MNETCIKHALNMPDIGGCPYCEIDRLNKEINRLRQYEDAITSAIDGTLLVWNLMSTNHTVIKNDYWQNHLEEIDRLKEELEEERSSWSLKAVEQFNRADDLERQLDASQALLAEARAENERIGSVLGLQEYTKHIRQEAARECIKMVKRQAPPLIAHSITAAIMTEFVL